MQATDKKSIYDFTVEDINGDTFDFSTLKGKKVIIVNTASECGYTKQYEGLEELYQAYKGKGLVIVGFPSNDFGGQEPGSNEEIASFCKLNYGVSFPMMSKISVKDEEKAPIYQFLTDKELNGKIDSEVHWNFQKYLINEDGSLETFYVSKIEPLSPEIVGWVEGIND